MNSVNALFHRIANPLLVLMAADLLAGVLAFWLAVGLRFGFHPAGELWPEGSTGPRALVFAAFLIMALLSMGMYRVRQRPTGRETVVRVMLALVLTALGCIVIWFLIPALAAGRGVLSLAIVAAGAGVYAVRTLLLPAMDSSPAKRRVLVLGAGRAAAKIGMLRRRADRRRFTIVGYVPVDEMQRSPARSLGVTPLCEFNEETIRKLRVNEIVVALDDRRGTFPVEQLLRVKLSGIPVTGVVTFLERETEKIDLDVLHPAWLLFEHSRHTEIAYRWMKRWFDVAFSLLMLILLLPVMLAVALLIAADSGFRGPVFYRQTRVGRHGRTFQLLKFRSMRVDAEAVSGPQWANAGDARVTRVGQWLRRFRLDELPQLINIIRGDMSVVGPRPERPEFVETISGAVPLYYYRHCVRPGLAGWAQLNFPYGASVEDAREKLKYDLYYIKNASIITDLLILMQTAEVVFLGRGTAMAGRRRPDDGGEPAVAVAGAPPSDLAPPDTGRDAA